MWSKSMSHTGNMEEECVDIRYSALNEQCRSRWNDVNGSNGEYRKSDLSETERRHVAGWR